ncbi:HNH endonuclease [Sphingomonas sp. QA11]|uniref:HNH endonuclease n=1 Tax=Sphingomonas sp. QA11 TaxID=2950605 RepID=UPI0023491D87|nr:HNH endonuclease [Sphingomonas sp. QA11]WCM29173.1 HNH endonuclease [Sphingomonas sp. QA11]
MSKDFRIELDGQQLDAAISVESHAIILESRGGTGAYARNSQYSRALETILARSLGTFSNLERVLLASRDAVRSFPDAASRVIAEGPELVALGPAAAASAIRTRMRDFGKPPGNHVGNSTKRLRFEFGSSNLVQQLKLHRVVEAPERLSYGDQRKVTPADIHAAVFTLAQGGDAPNFANSRDYDLVTPGGLRFPPKKVFGLALERALGIKAFPAHFSAGWSQPSFELLQAAGYVILPKGEPGAGEKVVVPGSPPLPSEDDDRRWVEGHPKRVTHLRRERAPGLARDKKSAVLIATGKLVCEECGFEPAAKHGAEFLDAGIEVHHKVPLADLPSGTETALADLVVLCATCHRIEHRKIAFAKTSGSFEG